MKRKITRIRPDGSKEIIEEHDEAPQMHTATQKAHQQAQQLAAKGNKGDTQLAHINNYEAMLLKKLGGAGTINPRTGLKQYYTNTFSEIPLGGGAQLFPETPLGGNLQTGTPVSGTGGNYVGNYEVSPTMTNLGAPALTGGTGTGFTGRNFTPTEVGAYNAYENEVNRTDQRPAGQVVLPPAGYFDWTQSPVYGGGNADMSSGNVHQDQNGFYLRTGPNGQEQFLNNGQWVDNRQESLQSGGQTQTTGGTQPAGYTPSLSEAITPQTPGEFDIPLNIAPYSVSGSQSGAQNTSNSLGVTQSTGTSNQGSYNLGTNTAQNTSNSGSQNQATNTAQNTASNQAQNTASNQAQNTASNNAQNTSFNQGQNTASNNAQNTNLSQAQNTNLSQAQNTAENQGITMGQQGSFNTGSQGSENMAVNNSFTNSINYSGLDPAARQTLTDAVMPQLQSVAQMMPEQYDTYTNEAYNSYQMMLQNALKKQIPQTIKAMADRGIISSTDGQKMLSQVMSDAAIAASDKGYQTAMQAALAKATNIPDALAKIAALGQYTSGGSAGGSTGVSSGTSYGNTLGTSYGSNLGINTGTSQGTSLGVGQGTSYGYGQGTSTGQSQGTTLGGSQGTSSGVSQGTSTGQSQGTSTGQSQGTSTGQSQGTSAGQSTGNSFANAQGTSAGMNQGGSFGNSANQSTGINTSNSQGTNFANSNSFQTDPTVMYRTAADVIQSMMP
jgi:hypothetical protein